MPASRFRPLATAAVTLTIGGLTLGACFESTSATLPTAVSSTATTSTGTGMGPGQGICLLNNCNSDLDCAGCEEGRETCLLEENRCVACNPVTGDGCAPGEECSSFGLCVPSGLSCPTDNEGVPTISCDTNADCAACSPMNQICAFHKCVACHPGDTSHCLSSDICIDNQCSPKCPQTCSSDMDCSQCGAPGNEAHACNNHVCTECSESVPCGPGLECKKGSCIPGCGIPGPVAGGCLADEDCVNCGDGDGSYECDKPVNANDPDDHGVCAPAATGCSDLGVGIAVLPDPWNDYTNLCSNDADCNGVGIDFSVSELIKDIIGSDSIDLGFTEIDIEPASVTYGMNACADIQLTNNIACGVCVPCESDADCNPIELDPLLFDLFANDPLAAIAGSLLLDLLYGDNPDHDLNFFCQEVAAG